MCGFSRMDFSNKSKLSRLLTLIFIVSIFLHGVLILSTSIWLFVANVVLPCSFLTKYYAALAVYLVAGVSNIAVVGASMFGSYFFKRSFVRIFMFCLAFVVSLELACIITSSTLRNENEENLKKDMKSSVISILSKNDTLLADSESFRCWRAVQTRRSCCGVDSYSDWCPGTNNSTGCLQSGSQGLEYCSCTTDCQSLGGRSLHTTSCYSSISDNLATAFTVITSVCSVVIILQCVTYWSLYFILPKINSKAVVDTYKPKPVARASNVAVSDF
ncbi:tetraspanin-9-like [Mya arenaria]|uniref:tetraspanin-9-like n=1 Tax=Mya arenaria TaxID=6604 RepID=UPI0022E51E89|nr:tetraspanin-9-like [Mya arenaria]